MKIGVIGAGAIGGFFAARLARAGHEVAVLARGATLDALRTNGLRLDSGGGSDTVEVDASDRAEALGAQELLVIAVKAPALAEVMPAVAAMRSPDTVVVPALNGLPWWFFLDAPGSLAGRRLLAVDADGSIERTIPLDAVLGAVVFGSCSTPAPGHVVHASGNRVVFGEPRGGSSERARQVAEVFTSAGFEAEASVDVRREIWLKLLGNACFNPVSMITRAHTDALIDDAGVHALFVAMMDEMLALGRAIGIDVPLKPVERIALTRKLGHVRTSMLQDARAGRPVELDAILGVLVEVAAAAQFGAPMLSAVNALARVHAQQAGLLPRVVH